MKKLTSTFTVVCFLFLGIGFTFAADIRWDAYSKWPPNNHLSKGIERFAAQVTEKSGGKLVVTPQVGGSLGYKGPELLKIVKNGLVPVSDILIPEVQGDEMIFGITTLPFIAGNVDEGKLLLDTARPYFEKILAEKWNQKLLYYGPWPPAGFWSKKPLNSVADFKNLKTRTYDKNGASVMSALSATPYPLPFSELYSGLATGLIDSVITSTITGVDAKLWEVLDHFYPLGITFGPDMTTVNLTRFNKLSPELQKVVMDAGRDTEKALWSEFKSVVEKSDKTCSEHGVTLATPSSELMDGLKNATMSIRDEWLKKAPPEAQKVLDAYNAARKK